MFNLNMFKLQDATSEVSCGGGCLLTLLTVDIPVFNSDEIKLTYFSSAARTFNVIDSPVQLLSCV